MDGQIVRELICGAVQLLRECLFGGFCGKTGDAVDWKVLGVVRKSRRIGALEDLVLTWDSISLVYVGL